MKPATLEGLLGLGVLFAFAALGEFAGQRLKLPLPGSVLGMLLLWLALGLGVVRLSWVERAADALLGVLGLLFVPAGVGLIEYLNLWRSLPLWLGIVAAGVLLGAGVAGTLARWLER